MHVVSVMYPPGSEGSGFNLQHYVSVHLKLGFRLMKKHFGIAPEGALVLHSTSSLEAASKRAPYLTMCWVCFRSRADADLFKEVFGIEEAARALQADWSNYCPAPPELLIGEVLQLSGDEVLRDADQVLEQLAISLVK